MFNAVFALDMPGFLSPGDVNNHPFVFSPNIDPKNEEETTEFSIKFDYDITETLELSFAIRYDREEREVATKVPPPSARRSNFINYTG